MGGQIDAGGQGAFAGAGAGILAIAINGRDAKQQQLVLDAYRKADQTRHVVAALGDANPLAAPFHLQAMNARNRLEKQIAELKKRPAGHPDDAGGARAEDAARRRTSTSAATSCARARS